MVYVVDFVFDANSTFAFKHNLRGVRMRDDIQVALMAVGVKVGSGRVPTLTALFASPDRATPQIAERRCNRGCWECPARCKPS